LPMVRRATSRWVQLARACATSLAVQRPYPTVAMYSSSFPNAYSCAAIWCGWRCGPEGDVERGAGLRGQLEQPAWGEGGVTGERASYCCGPWSVRRRKRENPRLAVGSSGLCVRSTGDILVTTRDVGIIRVRPVGTAKSDLQVVVGAWRLSETDLWALGVDFENLGVLFNNDLFPAQEP